MKESSPVEVRVWSVNFWMNSSSNPDPASVIHCLSSIFFSAAHIIAHTPDIFLELNYICCWCDPDVEGQLKPVNCNPGYFYLSTYLSGTTLVWTPPLIMVRLTVVTSPSVLFGSASSRAFSWALCRRNCQVLTFNFPEL